MFVKRQTKGRKQKKTSLTITRKLFSILSKDRQVVREAVFLMQLYKLISLSGMFVILPLVD